MTDDDRRCDPPRHRSGYVWCPCHGATALINAVEREARCRTVVWCSLRGVTQCCSEVCGTPRPTQGGE